MLHDPMHMLRILLTIIDQNTWQISQNVSIINITHQMQGACDLQMMCDIDYWIILNYLPLILGNIGIIGLRVKFGGNNEIPMRMLGACT